MNYLYKKQLYLYLLILFTLNGCKDDPVTPAQPTSQTDYPSVNAWLYEVMQDAYFWYKELPASTTLEAKSDPNVYFEKLVYQRSTVDRFSMVTEDKDALQNQFNGISKIFGIHYSISYIDNGNNNVGLFLSYVVKGSPAEQAGLKRGDIILKANNTQLTKDNYTALLSGAEKISVTLGTLNGTVFTPNSSSIQMSKAVVSEDPVTFSTIIDKSDYGKKIGYVVYSQFVPGTDADKNKYDNELRQIFAEFKTKGVNELVLDLRFNSGGYISSAITLASLIGKNAGSSKIFYKEQWNDKYQAYWQKMNGADALHYNFTNETNNIGSQIDRVFVLTSEGTASASELVINGLKPYISVITVGNHTAGKNLFGSLIGDEKERWKWGVYVMLGQTTNVNGESDYGTVNGMTPTYPIDDSKVPFKAFGDENETLFRKVLDVMGIPVGTGTRTAATKTVQTAVSGTFRDDLRVRENLMIKNKIPFQITP